MDKDNFLKEHRISKESFDATKLDWKELEKIAADHSGREKDLEIAGNSISEKLRQIPEVHSIKMRVKDSAHLVAKIIRKKEEKPDRVIDFNNYRTEIVDRVGVRALHLYKEDWITVGKGIQSAWNEFEPPKAYYREGDSTHTFTQNGCGTQVHPNGYRSVHYIVKLEIAKEHVPVEIQVRTIFEEGWSEIDHQIRYPHGTDVEALSQCLALFNRLAGSADECGSYTRRLKKDWDTVAKELAKAQRERNENIATLEKVKQEHARDAKEVQKLQAIIDSFKAPTSLTITPTTSTGMLGPTFDLMYQPSIQPTVFPSSGFSLISGSTAPVTNLRLCGRCGRAYSVGLLLPSACPHCGFANP